MYPKWWCCLMFDIRRKISNFHIFSHQYSEAWGWTNARLYDSCREYFLHYLFNLILLKIRVSIWSQVKWLWGSQNNVSNSTNKLVIFGIFSPFFAFFVFSCGLIQNPFSPSTTDSANTLKEAFNLVNLISLLISTSFPLHLKYIVWFCQFTFSYLRQLN